jgi:hypothetical protein
MSQPQEPREVFPYQVYDGRAPIETGKDFSIRPTPSDLPEVEPAEVEETQPDPKGSSVTGSAEFLDLIPSAAEVIPVDAEMDLEPITTDPLKPTSSTSLETGRSEPSVAQVAATTPTTGSAKPQKRVTAPRPSASTAP